MILAVLTVISLCALFGCYRPDESEQYFEVDGAYRIIELDEDKTEIIEKYGLDAFPGPYYEDGMLTVSYYYGFGNNFLFFDHNDGFDRKAFDKIYECIGVSESEQPIKVNKYFTSNSSGLCTYDKIFDFEKPKRLLINDWMVHGDGYVYGYVAKVKKYYLNYTDCSKKDGEILGIGTFCVLYCLTAPEVGYFKLEEFTSIYN